ncbi:MAG: Gfo/Idh/MocA family protein, partial [Brachybacterium sp.]
FVTPTSPFSIEVQGTEGSFQHGLGKGGGTSVDTGQGPVPIDVPGDAENPFAQWARAIRSGQDTAENLGRAQALTALVVAANAAAA